MAKNFWLSNVNADSPAPTGPNTAAGLNGVGMLKVGDVKVVLAPPLVDPTPGLVGVRTPPDDPVLAFALLIPNFPARSAQSMPRRVSSFSVISATRTSISTCRGIRSSCLIVASMSDHCRGVVVTMIAFVVSSAMKRTWPSTSGASAVPAASGGPGATEGGGGVGGAGWPGTRPAWLDGVVVGVVVVCTVSRAP